MRQRNGTARAIAPEGAMPQSKVVAEMSLGDICLGMTGNPDDAMPHSMLMSNRVAAPQKQGGGRPVVSPPACVQRAFAIAEPFEFVS